MLDTLSSSSVYAIATGRSQTRIDSSALDRRTILTGFIRTQNHNRHPRFSNPRRIKSFPHRPSQSQSPSRIPQCIFEALNSNSQSFKFQEFDVTEMNKFAHEISFCLGLCGNL